MNSEQASEYLNGWLSAAPLLDLPLLEVKKDRVTPVLHTGKHPRLRCSEQMVEAIAKLSATIIADWSADHSIEGMAYLIYRRRKDDAPDPLYVGIANSANKKGDRHSALWRGRGARFSDAYKSNGHVDCLSRSLLEGEEYAGYRPWVEALFGASTVASKLLQPVFVHLELWNARAHRVMPSMPDAPLFVEEMLRLWVLKTCGFGPQLLNRDGN